MLVVADFGAATGLHKGAGLELETTMVIENNYGLLGKD